MALVPWTDLPMCDSDGDIEPRSERGRAALAEYRRTGEMNRIWLCDYADLSETHDPTYDGPEVDEIDWTGFQAPSED